jgi:thioredoxin reductase
VEPESYEVAILGGGPAGLAAALVLGRMRRRVLLLDAGQPANAASEGVHGFFGHDGTPPLELRRVGLEHLRRYESVTVRNAAVDAVRPDRGGFHILAGETTADAGLLLLATGVQYELPPLEGLAELWGHGAYHCPYCHGWELRDQPLAAYRSTAIGLALLLSSLSDDVVLLTDTSAEPAPSESELLKSAGVAVRRDSVARVEGEGGRLARIVFADGSTDERAGIFLVPRAVPGPLVQQLDCKVDESGAIITDDDGRTDIPGLFAAGDVTTERKAVVLASASGSRAAYAINAGLARRQLP